jgi:hypothetical protein
LIVNDKGSLSPGTALLNTISNIFPRFYSWKFEARPLTRFNLYYCSSFELWSKDKALRTRPTRVVSTAELNPFS